MKNLVRAAAAYNFCGALSFVVPGALPLVGVAPPAPFWAWLPALIGFFAGMVLLLSSRDLRKYGAFPYWNGLVRLAFVALTFLLGFSEEVGPFVSWLAVGDVPLGLVCVLGLPKATGRSHRELLTDT